MGGRAAATTFRSLGVLIECKGNQSETALFVFLLVQWAELPISGIVFEIISSLKIYNLSYMNLNQTILFLPSIDLPKGPLPILFWGFFKAWRMRWIPRSCTPRWLPCSRRSRPFSFSQRFPPTNQAVLFLFGSGIGLFMLAFSEGGCHVAELFLNYTELFPNCS